MADEADTVQKIRAKLERKMGEAWALKQAREALLLQKKARLQPFLELKKHVDDLMAAVDEEFDTQLAVYKQDIEQCEQDMIDTAAPVFMDLVKPRTKTIYLRHGEIGKHKPSVKLIITDLAAVFKWAAGHGRARLITRWVHEVVTEALKDLLVKNPKLKVLGAHLEYGDEYKISIGKKPADAVLSVHAETAQEATEA